MGTAVNAFPEEEKTPLRKIGGFLCVNLKPYINNADFMIDQGPWAPSTLSLDIWKRHGVPFWFLGDRGTVFVAGESKGVAPPLVIPLNGVGGEEVFVLGNVGRNLAEPAKAGKTVGRYVVAYESGEEETIPLVAGKNVADMRYGHFVPEAEVAFMQPDLEETNPLSYHLDEMLPVEPKKQLMMFGHKLAYPGKPLKSMTLCVTDPEAGLYLAAITLRQSGPRMNAIVYNSKMIEPYPRNTPKADPSPIEALQDKGATLGLDGDWQYATDPGNQGIEGGYFRNEYDSSGWKRMPVPSQWYVQGLDYHGVVWFRRDFDVRADFPGSVAEFCFGGVDYDARVWLNGQYIGRHIGAYASFKLDATAALKKGGQNTIVVRVDSPIDPGYGSHLNKKTIIKGNAMDDIAMPYGEEGCMGGIFRPVALAGRGTVGVENIWATSAVSSDLKHADVSVRLELNPKDALEDAVQIRCRLTEPRVEGRQPRVFRAEKTVALADRTPVELPLSIDNPLLWYPWEQGRPDLHVLEIEVWRGEQRLDRRVSRVGVREVAFNASQSCVEINHHRIFLKGMLYDDPHWMSMMDRTGYRQRIRLLQDANLNLFRLTTHQSAPDMYDLCDEMGIMIWQEMPLQWGYSQSEPVRKDIVGVVKDTVTQCRPHASVIGWSAWNEGGQQGFSEQITSTIRELDDTRPMTRACGGGDFDIHIYPNIIPAQLSRRTFFWAGFKLGFVSEVGAYGLSSLDEMKEIVGEDLFSFDSAEYFWETFNSYHCNDGPVFWDAPSAADWPTAKVREYVLSKLEPSQRWLAQFMKFMFENFRAQRFDPTTAAIHCRFDDAFPTAYLGIVNFNGRPRKAYDSVREACQQVLPILFFDFRGPQDLRVVNEYWNRSWKGCTLRYTLMTRDGKVLRRQEKSFDLPSDSTVKVLGPEEIGDVYHIPGGFFAELAVLDSNGKSLSENHYDLTEEEIRSFVTSVYPVPPVEPIDSQVIAADNAFEKGGVARRIDAQDTYAKTLLELGGDGRQPHLKFEVGISQDGDYLVRVASNSGNALRSFELSVDGGKAEPESYPYTDLTLGMTRLPYSTHELSWRPGWKVHFAKGKRCLELKWPDGKPAPSLIVDAICVQRDSNSLSN